MADSHNALSVQSVRGGIVDDPLRCGLDISHRRLVGPMAARVLGVGCRPTELGESDRHWVHEIPFPDVAPESTVNQESNRMWSGSRGDPQIEQCVRVIRIVCRQGWRSSDREEVIDRIEISVGSSADDREFADVGQHREVPPLFAFLDVRDVHFNGRDIARGYGVP